MDDTDRFKEIEFNKSNLTEKQKELYDLCKEFWNTEAGKKAIRQSRR
jgi:hypothetical protein